MALGPGKYDDLCTHARKQAKAKGVILLVFGGKHGTGFCVQTDDLDLLTRIPEILRTVAGSIESDIQEDVQRSKG